MAEGRSATWLELFFDVIFVINIAGLTHHLVAHPDLDTLAQVAGLYLPLFLVWAGHTTYATRFDDGSVLQTILTLLLMFTLAGSAAYVQSGIDEHAASFTRAQFAARVLLVLLYLEAHLRVAAARRFTWFLMIGFALSAVAWGAQEWTAASWDRPLYVAAVGVEVLAPLLAEAVRSMVPPIRAGVLNAGGIAARAYGPGLTGARMLFGGLAVWLTCFLAMRVYVAHLRRLGVAEWTTAGAVAALAAGAVLIGPVRTVEVFIFAGSLLLALAVLGSLLKELRARRAAASVRRAR